MPLVFKSDEMGDREKFELIALLVNQDSNYDVENKNNDICIKIARRNTRVIDWHSDR